MAMSEQVGIPYAEALIALGQETQVLDDIANDARLILASLKEVPELGELLTSPVVAADAKKNILQAIFAERVHPLTLNFIQLLSDRRRVMFLSTICTQFLERQRQLRGIALAEVTSVVPLTEAQQSMLQERLKAVVKATQVELELKQDDRLLGGMVVRVGSQVIDLSVRGQLRRLALQLA
ncbi:MAG: ATP synthase F1 subunit delta [Synechococcales cyanobacterium]